MSVTIYGITGKSVKATLHGEAVDLRLGRFVCMDNGFFEIDKAQGLINKARSNFMRSRPATYFVDDVQGNATDLAGSVVYRVPENYQGTHKDYELEKYEIVGTLLTDYSNDGKLLYKIETDPNTVEQLRREREFQRMKAGLTHIGSYGNDVEAYKQALKERDAESATGMAARGHGLS